MALLKINNLSVYYNDYIALQNINLEVNKNDYIGIIGPNGSGKTTLLKSIIGDITPDSGKIILEPNTIIGYVPQFSTFNKEFPITVFEVILSGTLPTDCKLFHHYRENDRTKVTLVIDKLKIGKLADKQINQLSGGQLQKVLLARALVTNPDILLLDEPTASLDTDAKEEIYNILSSLNKEITIIMVSHDIGMIKHKVKTFACLNKTMHVHENDETIDPWHFEDLFYKKGN
ncbi:zinc ABC transporter ATP-binding protein [Vallitalea longa]|uniref:Zinc ABC transporter ATP-binding protein n=1 Tax=Vallitalea longa TaxID=2936439 RepID=A0A9W5YHP8_9FIRM|nr:ABC transporter ATP-binding protein [Vallitalea longa]GKX31423.1 zinc ABC transporter ATP-binding protein [Vallitalea longa]